MSEATNPRWFQASAMAAMQLKEHIVAARGIGEDIAPFLDLRRGTEVVIASLPSDVRRGDAARWAIAAQRPECVTLIDEAYQYVGSGALGSLSHFYQTYRHGDLAKRFAAGDENVAESLLVIGTDGVTVYQLWVPYRYQGRKVEWLDPDARLRTEGMSFDGAIYEGLQEGFEMAREGFPQPEALREAEELGVRIMTNDELIEEQAKVLYQAGRNQPCPCGSGRKFKHCHG